MRQVTVTTVLTAATGSTTIEGATTANAFDLTVLQTVKDELRITNTDNDVLLGRAIQRGSAAIAAYCNRVFPVQQYQDVIWLQADDYPYQVPGRVAPLTLANWPLCVVPPATTAVTSCVVTEGVLYNQTLVENTDFVGDYATGELIRLNIWTNFPTWWDAAPTQVQYTAGFAQVPADVEEALLRWIAGWFQSRTRDPNLKVEEQPGLGRREYWIPNAPETHFAPEVSELLDKYRVPVAR